MPSGETSRVGKGDSDRLGGVAGDGGTGITGPKDSDSLIHRVTELEIVPREAKEGFESDVVELQQETVKTAVLVDALENDASVAMEDTERVHHEEGQKKRERAAWQRVDGINPFAGTLRDRGQHDELYTLSENKIVQKEQAILELKNQTPACYHNWTVTRCSLESRSQLASLARRIPVYEIMMASFLPARSCPRCRKHSRSAIRLHISSLTPTPPMATLVHMCLCRNPTQCMSTPAVSSHRPNGITAFRQSSLANPTCIRKLSTRRSDIRYFRTSMA
ncbi:hypothetical protein BKA70DRAFT_1356166 [Coprinopsis sp. MPI-PUGE-AT-0042]|nr:hypothetical protein BKA70DRAFT_1356166 [Coprinopsis sp. MPI-PUGE-AT-0042]